MNKPTRVRNYPSKSASPARRSRRFALTFLSFAIPLLLCSSCSGLWTSLQNPVDPEACKVDSLDYGRLFYGDQGSPTNIDPVLEKLRSASGYQVLYVGFNDGSYAAYGTAPFIMITTKYIAQTYESNGMTYANFPILTAMTITDSLGAAYTPGISTTGGQIYVASDGNSYTYDVATFWATPNISANSNIDTNLTYYVNISATNVVANDGTPLDRPYSFVVSKASANSGLPSTGLMDGLTAAFSSDFSASDPYWEWSKDYGAGFINTVSGKYTLSAQATRGSEGYGITSLFCKRYPYAIQADTFAVRVTDSFSDQASGPESGLYVSDSSGNPVAAVMLGGFGWLQFFGPGSSPGVLRKVREQSVRNFDYTSTVLGIRQDGGRLYFYVNGECVASADRPHEKITNAGLFIAGSDPNNQASASFDDFAIAQ